MIFIIRRTTKLIDFLEKDHEEGSDYTNSILKHLLSGRKNVLKTTHSDKNYETG